MSATVSTPLTGVPRFRQLVELERIARELHTVAVQGTSRVRSEAPDFEAWGKDLRRGRLRIGGGFLRFLDILARRQDRHAARSLALQVLALLADAVDIVLPVEATSPEPTRPLLHAPVPATKPALVHPSHPTGRARLFLPKRSGRGGQAA